jgi:hypothetical protein
MGASLDGVNVLKTMSVAPLKRQQGKLYAADEQSHCMATVADAQPLCVSSQRLRRTVWPHSR